MIKIKIENISKKYDKAEKYALENINLNIENNGIVALIGSNGSGKSTFLNTLGGFINREGNVIYEGLEKRRNMYSHIGFCPQSQVMDWYTNVFDNVVLGPLMAGKKLREAKALSLKALEIVSLTDKKDSSVDSLSGGQQQRVQVARAIAHEPNIYFLDEPTTGLDAESSEKMLTYLKEKADEGAIVVISSHDLHLLEKYASKLIFLKEGKLKYEGTVEEFINKYSGDEESPNLRDLYLSLIA